MFSQTSLPLAENIKALLKHIKSIKKLIYYAYFEPDIFPLFMAQTIPEVRKKLPRISKALKKALKVNDSSDDKFKVNALRSDAYRIRYQLDKEILTWGQLLQEASQDALSLEEREVLEKFQQTWRSHFDECGKLVDKHEVWKSVSHHNHIAMKALCKQVCDDLISQHQLLLKYYQANQQACLSSLFSQHETILNLMMRYFTVQQKGQVVLYRTVNFHFFLQSIAKLIEVDRLKALPVELNEKQHQTSQFAHTSLKYRALKVQAEENLSSFLKHNPKFRKVLCVHLYDLFACQGYFSDWLYQLRNELAIGKLEKACEILNAQLADQKRLAASKKYSFWYEKEVNKAAISAAELKASQDNRFEKAVENFQAGNLPAALTGFLAGVADFHGSSFVHAGGMVLRGQVCEANPAFAQYLLMIGYALEDNAFNRLPIYVHMYKTVERHQSLQALEEKEIGAFINQYQMTDEQLLKRIYLCRDRVADKLFRLGEILISTIISGASIKREECKSFLERALFFFEQAYRYTKGAIDRSAAMLLKPGGATSDAIQKKHRENQIELDKMKFLIESSLALLNNDEYYQDAPPLVEAFYDRMKWLLPVSSAPVNKAYIDIHFSR